MRVSSCEHLPIMSMAYLVNTGGNGQRTGGDTARTPPEPFGGPGIGELKDIGDDPPLLPRPGNRTARSGADHSQSRGLRSYPGTPRLPDSAWSGLPSRNRSGRELWPVTRESPATPYYQHIG